jgi:hypothetical protein
VGIKGYGKNIRKKTFYILKEIENIDKVSRLRPKPGYIKGCSQNGL